MGTSTLETNKQKAGSGRFSEWYLSEGGSAADRLPAFTRHNEGEQPKLSRMFWDQGPIMQAWMILMLLNILIIGFCTFH
ncbi:MAG: hypothetical protein AB7P76_09420 [Candidatus Melainabacteria bacterium]